MELAQVPNTLIIKALNFKLVNGQENLQESCYFRCILNVKEDCDQSSFSPPPAEEKI